MQRTEVKSSQIKSIGYDPETQTLEVEFKLKSGEMSLYRYYDVPELIYNLLMSTESKGLFFFKEIRGAFKYEKIPTA